MSRSYKKTPCGVDKISDSKEMKKIANRLVRKNEMFNSECVRKKSFYKKLFDNWRIVEFKSFCTLKQFIDARIRYNLRVGINESMKKIKSEWQKWYYRK